MGLLDLLEPFEVFVGLQGDVAIDFLIVDQCIVLSQLHISLHKFHHSDQRFMLFIEDLIEEFYEELETIDRL